MKNLMIAFILLMTFSTGCEQYKVLTGGTNPDNSLAIEKNRTHFLYSCPAECSEDKLCTELEKINCDNNSFDLIVDSYLTFIEKKPKGTVCDILFSCVTKEEFFYDHAIIINSANPELVRGKVIDSKGNVFAETYISAFYEKSGEVALKFEIINKELINEFLTLEIEIGIDKNYEEKITITADLGK